MDLFGNVWQDVWPSQMEVALLEDVDEEEEFDPDTVYGEDTHCLSHYTTLTDLP